MFNRKKSRGIVLVLTLFIVVFVVMIASAIMVTTQAATRQSGDFYHREQALNAAMSGLAYAQMRLAEKEKLGVLWQGAEEDGTSGYKNSYSPSGIDSSKGLNVTEYHVFGGKGYVEGTVSGDGPVSKFFIYFTSPGGTSWSGNQKKDTQVGTVKARYKSLNNSFSNVNADNTLLDGSYYKSVPFYTCNLVVQGQCAGVTRHVEVMLVRLPDEKYDSVGISQKDIKMTLNNPDGAWNVSSVMSLAPVVRSYKDIIINSTNRLQDFVNFENSGKGRAKEEVTLNPYYGNPATLGLLSNQTIEEGHIPSIYWSSLDYSKKTEPVDLDAGTYVFRKDEEGKLAIDYYDSDSSREGIMVDTAQKDQSNAVDVNSNDPWAVFEFAKDDDGNEKANKVIIKQPIRVREKTGVTSEGKQITSSGITLQCDEETQLSLKMSSDDDKSIYIENSNGFVHIDGELTGKGAIYASGDVVFEGRSQLSADSGSICLFSEGDIILNDFSKPPETNTLGNPSKYIAEASKDFLDNDVKDKDGYREFDMSKKVIDTILDKEVQITSGSTSKLVKLKDLLEKKEYGYKYDKNKKEELVEEMLRNTADKIQAKDDKIRYKYDSSKYADRFQDIINNPDDPDSKTIKATDQILNGLVYSAGDFIANLGANRLTVQGALVSKNGMLDINAGGATFIYNPRYLGPLYQLGNCRYKQLYWGSF